jgi:hypothetical protein
MSKPIDVTVTVNNTRFRVTGLYVGPSRGTLQSPPEAAEIQDLRVIWETREIGHQRSIEVNVTDLLDGLRVRDGCGHTDEVIDRIEEEAIQEYLRQA